MAIVKTRPLSRRPSQEMAGARDCPRGYAQQHERARLEVLCYAVTHRAVVYLVESIAAQNQIGHRTAEGDPRPRAKHV